VGPLAMDAATLAQVETVCETLYKAQDAGQRQQSEQVRRRQSWFDMR